MTFEDTLATWLVKQRWFAGKGRTVHDLAVVADTEIIPGDPGLRHLIVTVSHGATSDCYQLFIGSRARLPARLRHARIGTHEGMQIYDGLHDTALTRTLLDAIVDDRTVGTLRFCRIPGAEIEPGLDSLVLTGEQSNTSLVFGESAIFKVFRRVTPGPNPDLEVASALAKLGSEGRRRPRRDRRPCAALPPTAGHGAGGRARRTHRCPRPRAGGATPDQTARPGRRPA